VVADSPEMVAEYAYRKLMQNKEVIVPGLMNRLSRIMPTGVKIKLVAMMKDLKRS
jgi:short-subunit dehydrogenase